MGIRQASVYSKERAADPEAVTVAACQGPTDPATAALEKSARQFERFSLTVSGSGIRPKGRHTIIPTNGLRPSALAAEQTMLAAEVMAAKLRISAGPLPCPPGLTDCAHRHKGEIAHQEYHKGCRPSFHLCRTLLKD